MCQPSTHRPDRTTPTRRASRAIRNTAPHPNPRRGWSVRAGSALAVAGVLTVGVAGCSGENNAGPTRSTTVPARLATTTSAAPATVPATAVATSRVAATTPPATTAASLTTDEAAQQILEVQNAYRAAMDAINDATMDPVNPNLPALDTTLDGEMLTGWRGRISSRQAEGIAARRGEGNLATINIRSVNVSGSVAQLLSCEIDDWVQYRVSDGAITNGEISTSVVDAELRSVDGIWKVVARVPRSVEKGKASCAQ